VRGLYSAPHAWHSTGPTSETTIGTISPHAQSTTIAFLSRRTQARLPGGDELVDRGGGLVESLSVWGISIYQAELDHEREFHDGRQAQYRMTAEHELFCKDCGRQVPYTDIPFQEIARPPASDPAG
jgi:hypothetical protein